MVVKQLNSSYFWSPVEKTDFSIGVVIPVTHVNEVLNTLQIPKGKDGFSLYKRVNKLNKFKSSSSFNSLLVP